LKKLIITIGIVVVIILSVSFYTHQNYIFSPISFKKDSVLVHDWSDYRHPLVMEISNVDEGWKTTSISNKEDIKFIYKELRSGKKALGNRDDSFLNTHFAITVRSKGTEGSNGVIDQFDGYIDGIVHINNGEKIHITGRLNKYIDEVIPK
jgi:hypothetical protein